MKTITIPVVDDLTELTDEQVSEILKLEKLLLGMFKATKEIALDRLNKGGTVPGWKLAPGKRSRDWIDEQAAIDAMSAAGMNDPYKRELYSPAQAEKMVPDTMKELLAQGYEWKPGKPTMKQTTAGAAAAFDLSVFEGITAHADSADYGW